MVMQMMQYRLGYFEVNIIRIVRVFTIGSLNIFTLSKGNIPKFPVE